MSNKPITVLLLFMCSLLFSATPPARAAHSPDHHGMQVRLAACAACHGKDGEGKPQSGAGVYPRLAGQPAGYLYRQMVHFSKRTRTGIPPVDTMNKQLDQLSNSYLHLIAQYYSQSEAPFPPHEQVAPAILKEGRKLVRNGIPSLGIKSCTGCHGANLRGKAQMGAPALAGQYARYLKIQFRHWAQGERSDVYHKKIVEHIAPARINALVAYISSLRPKTTRPPDFTRPPSSTDPEP